MPGTDPEPTSTPTPPRVPVSNYRCREHLDVATTWRGTGCHRCAAEHKGRTTRRERRAARAARRAAVEDY